ncbi:Flp family type IVb pilin [Phenylobacterium sp.]|uniref:Flp family type IVb pilin n=1 Tax=Phenylobacterium sp. TaxID=1871053 RepID=UPI0035B143B0
MKSFLKRFLADQAGATAVEYALIAGLITIILVSVMAPVKVALTNTFQTVANAMPQP